MSSMDKEVGQLLSLLRTKIRERGYTQMEVQEKLDWGRSYVSQLLGQQKSVRIDQVLSILNVIGVEPREFYAELYQWPRPDVGLRNLDEYSRPTHLDMARYPEILGETTATDVPPSDAFFRNYRELRAMVRAVVQVLVERDLVTVEEFAELARAAEPGLRRP